MARQPEIQNIIEQHDLAVFAETRLGIPRISGTSSFHCFNKDHHRNGDANPSLVIYKDFFKCFGCGIKGDLFELLNITLNLDFKQSIEFLKSDIKTRAKYSPPQPVKALSLKFNPSEDSLKFMYEFWNILKETLLSDSAKNWLESRGITCATAYKIGCREISSSPLAIKRLVSYSFDPSSVGFAHPTNKNKLWFPLQNLNHHTCLLFPSWSLGYEFPIQWRCRLYKNWNIAGKTIKSLAQYSSGKIIPLGMKKSDSKITIICEGEPDFLSLNQVSSDLFGKVPSINIIGTCAISQGWQSEWTSSLINSQKIVVAVHDNHEGKSFAAKVARNIVQAKGIEFARNNVFRMLFDEKDDANDFHQRGMLNEWLINLLKGIDL